MPREGVQRRAAATKSKSYNEFEYWNDHVEDMGEEEGQPGRDRGTPTPDQDDEDIEMRDSDEVPLGRTWKPGRRKRNPDEEYTVDDVQDAEGNDEVSGEEELEDDDSEKEGEESDWGSDVLGPVREKVIVGTGSTPTTPAHGKANRPPPKRKFSKTAQKVHARGVEAFRGLEELHKHGGRQARAIQLFGPSDSNLLPVLKTRDTWSTQDTLPSRKNNGLRHSFFISDEGMAKETNITRKWYDEVGQAKFAEGQKTKELSKEEGATFLANDAPDEINFLMGAHADPLLYCLKQRRHLSTTLPFVLKEGRRGWVLYLGARIQETQWAYIENGSTQYLAVAVEQKRMTGRQHKPLENPKAPAFAPTKEFLASVQIWAFDSDEEGQLDPKKEPRLELLICTEWGAPKALRWCPVPPAHTNEESTEETYVHLGLLAGIWSDGKVRILDVSFEKLATTPKDTKYIHYTKAAFEISFHNSIATCLSWMSGTSLIVGTAHGILAFWTLTRPETFPPPNHPPGEVYKPPPRLYKSVSNTHIISMTSGYPSRPTYISITTADGLGWLIDIRSPTLDVVNNPRCRMYSITQAWHEHTQSFVSPDESFLFRCNSIRRFYTNIYCMRTESQVFCCATSPVHPITLLGTADGTVVAGNPIMRVLNYKEKPWQQIWFRHEWRRPVSKLSPPISDPSQPPPAAPEDDSSERSPATETPLEGHAEPSSAPATFQSDTRVVPPEILAKPLTRISEGFKAQPITLHFSKPGMAKGAPDQGGRFLTVYEEPSTITCVAWNPNVQWGTWACAGMGDGLLRVEDIGV